MGSWDVKTARLACRQKYKEQVLELCRCAGVTGRPRMGNDGYMVGRRLPIRDAAFDPELSLSADNITISPEELFTVLNRLYGPVKLFYEWEEGETYTDRYHRLERLFDPATMQLTQMEFDRDAGYDIYLKGRGYELIRGQIEAAAKEQDIEVFWRRDESDGALLPDEDAEIFQNLCDEMGEKLLAREDKTGPIIETEPDPSAVATLFKAAEDNSYTELVALLREKFQSAAENEMKD